MTTTTIVGLLDLGDAIGTMLECSQDVTVEGALGDYIFAWKNGQQILIGSRQQEALTEESVVGTTPFVFMSKDDGRQQRRPTTWSDLRALVAEGWVVGTDRKPGVKGWYPKTGRSIRRQMQDIYVFREPRTTGSGDSINVGDISNSIVAIGAGASVNVTINRIVQGLGDLPTRHDASVRNFLDYYIGTSDAPEPFGGREPDLAAYTSWLNDPAAPPYALLTAPAGRGKSAALAHWVVRTEPRKDVAVVFLPISDRFQTNSESVVFSALYARLAHLHGDRPTQAFSAAEYRGAFQDYLTRPLPDGRRLLVVLDGLDETAGWEAQTGLFPTRAPAHLKVLVAAREVAGELDWATRLGWRIPEDALTFGLSTLSRQDLVEVMHRMGDPLAGLKTNFDLLDKLYELTDHGDPLMIRLYVEALRKDQGRIPDLKPEDLQGLEPGLGSFFALWFQQQEHLWRADGSQVNREAVDTLISARAVAFGPLTSDDLIRLAPEAFTGSRGVQRVADAFRRFLVGSGSRGSGFSFSHPRLTEYFKRQLTERERMEWQRRFVDYGAATLSGLENGQLSPELASEYTVRHLRLHLQQELDSPPLLFALMCHGWLKAWRALDGMEGGFLDDAHAIMEQSAKAGPGHLGQVVRCALFYASVVSASTIIGYQLLLNGVRLGVSNVQETEIAIAREPDPHRRANAQLELVNVLAKRTGKGRLVPGHPFFEIAVRITRSIADADNRAHALVTLFDFWSTEEARPLMIEAIQTVRSIQDERKRANLLTSIAWRLPDGDHALLAEAKQLASAIRDDRLRSQVISKLIDRMPLEDTRPNLMELWDTARTIKDTDLLVFVAAHLSGRDKDVAKTEALEIARSIAVGEERIKVLLSLTAILSSNETRSILVEVLHIASTISDDRDRLGALRTIAELWPDHDKELLVEALQSAYSIRDERIRAHAVATIAGRMPRESALPALFDAWDLARLVGDASLVASVAVALPDADKHDALAGAVEMAESLTSDEGRATVLSTIASYIPQEEARPIFAKALDALQMINSPRKFSSAVYAVLHMLPEADQRALVVEAQRRTRTVGDYPTCASGLLICAEHLPAEEAANALSLASILVRREDNTAFRVVSLLEVAQRMPTVDAPAIFEEALVMARTISNPMERAVSLSKIAQYAPSDVAVPVVNEAKQNALVGWGSPLERIKALTSVARYYPPAEGASLIAQAIELAQKLSDARDCMEAIRTIALNWPEDAGDHFEKVLQVARSIEPSWYRSNALVAIAARSSDKETTNQLCNEALASYRNSRDAYPEYLVYLLVSISDILPPDEAHPYFAEAIQISHASGDDLLAMAAAERIPVEQPGWMLEAWNLGNQQPGELQSVMAVEGVGPHLAVLAAAAGRTEHELLNQAIRSFSTTRRDYLLHVLIALMPSIQREGGLKAVRDTCRAIQEAAEWWP